MKMRRWILPVLILVLALCLLPATVQAETADSEWKFDVDQTTMTATITGYTGNDPVLRIPGEITDNDLKYKVTAIASYALIDSQADTIVIPGSVKSIGANLIQSFWLSAVHYQGNRSDLHIEPEGNSAVLSCLTHDWVEDNRCGFCEFTCQHTGGTANCQTAPVCERCGYSYSTINENVHATTETYYKEWDGTYRPAYKCCGAWYGEERLPHVYDENNDCTVCDGYSNVVVLHNDQQAGFDSVPLALDYAQTLQGAVVRLRSGFLGSTNGYTIKSGADVTIDLRGGCLINSSGNVLHVEAGAKLTVIDTVGGGYIQSTCSRNAEMYAIVGDGELHLKGGYIKKRNFNDGYSVYMDTASLYINGARVDGIYAQYSTSTVTVAGNLPGNCDVSLAQPVFVSGTLTGDGKIRDNGGAGSVVAKGTDGYILTESDAQHFAGSSDLVPVLDAENNSVVLKTRIREEMITLAVSEITYTGELQTPAVTVVSGAKNLTENVDYTLSYSNNRNAGTATVTVTGMGDYSGSAEKNFTISKAVAPAIEFPTVLNSITYGQPLSEAKLSTYEDPLGTFNWNAPTAFGDAGTVSPALDFYPNELALQNYNWTNPGNGQWIASRNALCICPNVTVNKADLKITAPVANDLIYTGEPQTLAQAGKWENPYNIRMMGNLIYGLNSDSLVSTEMPAATDAGTYTLWYAPSMSDEVAQNYNAVAPVKLEIEIKKADPTYTVPTELVVAPGQTLADVALPNGWSWADTSLDVGAAGAQTHNAVFTPQDTDNYNVLTVPLTLVVCPDVTSAENVTEENVTAEQKSELEQLLADVNAALAAEDQLPDQKAEELKEAKAKLEGLIAGLPPYAIISGDGSQWTVGSSADLTFVANGHFTRFTGIKVDGKDVDPANYTAASGSTKVILKASYLNTLSRGKHTITVCYGDGVAEGSFKIVKTGGAPDTFDPAQPVLLITLMTLSAVAMYLTLRKMRKI